MQYGLLELSNWQDFTVSVSSGQVKLRHGLGGVVGDGVGVVPGKWGIHGQLRISEVTCASESES